MPERCTDIEASALGPPDLEARLTAYPELRAKIETMLNIIENVGGDMEKTAVAEQHVIDVLRKLGNDVLQRWAHRQQQKQEAVCHATLGVNRKKKTLYWYRHVLYNTLLGFTFPWRRSPWQELLVAS